MMENIFFILVMFSDNGIIKNIKHREGAMFILRDCKFTEFFVNLRSRLPGGRPGVAPQRPSGGTPRHQNSPPRNASRMTDSGPLFSIITVTFNAAATLPATLASVREQTYGGEIDYIVMDGASRDGTPDIARSSGIDGITVVSEPDEGLYDAMNKALERARGEYVIFLNAGDTFHSPDVLARYAELIEANGKPGIVYGQTLLVDADRRPVGPRHLTAPERLTYASFADGMLVCHQAMAVLKRITAPYNLRYRFSADYEWCLRCLQHSRRNVYAGSEPVIDYLNEGVTTRNEFRSLGERFRIMCYYYGIVPTIMRHARFALRGLFRKLKAHTRKPLSDESSLKPPS